ncbi:MAG TPA: VOC family protein [Pyrinomonadaceae bacterium]|nr:VOC family protein [Pyrinomonadaceae bacterium]
MAEFSIPKPGEICWRELATKDLAKAIDFYSQLFGWKLEQTKVTPMDYKEIIIDGVACGGMMGMDESWGEVPSHWNTYVAVENADETVDKIKSNGGSVKVPPFDAPGVGRISIASDPSGAPFAIIQFAAAS